MYASAEEREAARAYHDALARLFARTGGAWRLGLERVAALLEALDSPHRRYPVFHVAGTNGKGSTVATLDALLRRAGLRVGRYTSPHLVDFSERIVVNGRPMSHADIARWLTAHEGMLQELGTTFFEATTAMALAHFVNARVDVAIVEVGLGGRLDATNLVAPVAAGVTQIGYDHLEYLGATLEQIAGEKAGIFKAGAPAIIGETRPEIAEVLIARAHGAGASTVLASGRDWQVDEITLSSRGTSFTRRQNGVPRRFTTPLVGEFQAHNTCVALAMLEAAGGHWAAIAADPDVGLTDVHIAGRFHHTGRWLFDVAHNADGAATVVANMRAIGLPHPVVAVVNVLRD
ncbi:MAG: bifunctional folylpolyglutamate synthase/dihydrofolate synthase, partial [Gemmatimonadaceae bacterium]|nr:bifunctional folylpolyglutamate synthase/dihydrofolate synthase [Gemmatimonadaceae bacterium]